MAHVACLRIDDRDSLFKPDVGVNGVTDELELVQVVDWPPPVAHFQATDLVEGVGIEKPQLGGAVTDDEPVIVAAQAPAFALIREGIDWLE